MAKYLNNTFSGRLHLTCGDSTESLISFMYLKDMCDLIIIDGGHSYETAMADVKNFKKMANPDHHIVIMDDMPQLPVKHAWHKALGNDIIKEIFVCEDDEERGFAVGIYNT